MLGSFAIRIAMLITMLAVIKVPRKENGEFEEGAIRIYNAVWITHLLAAVTLILNHYNAKLLGVGKHALNILAATF